MSERKMSVAERLFTEKRERKSEIERRRERERDREIVRERQSEREIEGAVGKKYFVVNK